MTEYEARNSITKIVESTEDYQKSVNSVQQQLIDELGNLDIVKNNIVSDITQNDIVSNACGTIDNIKSKINEALSDSVNALNTLSNDATEEIKRIVDNYNSSIVDEDLEQPKPRLSYVTVSLSSISGLTSEADISDTDSGSRSSGGSYYPSYQEDTFKTYFDRLVSSDVYSDQISNWDNYVLDFLNTYGLTSYIETIRIEGKKIICKYKDGKEEIFENINNIDDLVESIKAKIR